MLDSRGVGHFRYHDNVKLTGQSLWASCLAEESPGSAEQDAG